MTITWVGFTSGGWIAGDIGAVVAISTNISIGAGARWIAIRAIWCTWSTGVCWSWGISWCLLLASASSFFCRGAFFCYFCSAFFSFFCGAFFGFFGGFSFSLGFFLCFNLLLESLAFCLLLLPFNISITNKLEVLIGKFVANMGSFLDHSPI